MIKVFLVKNKSQVFDCFVKYKLIFDKTIGDLILDMIQNQLITSILDQKENVKLFPKEPPRCMPHITEVIQDLVTSKKDRMRVTIILNSIVNVLEKI